MKTTLNLDDPVMARLRREATQRGWTMSQLVESTLRLLSRSDKKSRKLPPIKGTQVGSRLAKIVHDGPLLIGSLVSMPRVCGKPGCKCVQGELHPGLYLSLRVGEKCKMIHFPQPLGAQVSQWVKAYPEVWRLMEKVSDACCQRFLREKQQVSAFWCEW